MKSLFTILLCLFSFNIFSQNSFDYPHAPKETATDIYFNDSIEDPYQWMENSGDPRLKIWLEKQENITTKQSNRQTQFWNLRSQIGAMFRIQREKIDGYVELDSKLDDKFEFKEKWNSYTGSKDLLYRHKENKNWKKLISGKDILEAKGDHIKYGKLNVQENENLVAIPISINGSDWATGLIFDLTTGEQFPYEIEHIRGTTNLEWHGRTLYYSAFNKPTAGREHLDKAQFQALYRISVNNSKAVPERIYRNPDTTGTNIFQYDIENEKLRLYHYIKSRNTWYRAISIADLQQERFKPQQFIVYPSEDGVFLNITHTRNDSIFLKTNIGAPNGKVLLADINKPNELSEFIPEYDINLQYVNQLGKNKLACVYLKEGQNIALIFDLKGNLLRKIDFPEGKKLNYFYEHSNESEITDFSISSFFHPETWYQIDLNTLEFQPAESLMVPYDINNLETRYITYKSADGTEIPMYITCKKGTVLDGNNPVLIYAYGGYGKTVEPSFREINGLLLAHGGILAVPNVRGGGANGTDWALAGRRRNKPKAIEDFIAAAQYLINNEYTTSEKLVISGGSHGALLVEAAATKRPELFKAVIAEAGPYDMLRFNRFTVGGVNINLNEFGSPSNLKDYQSLKSYSPFHNLKKGRTYPNTLLITGDSDDRVPPLHTYKFLARLQEFGDSSRLYHMYITPGSGHGGALSPQDNMDKFLFEYYFMFDQMDIQI